MCPVCGMLQHPTHIFFSKVNHTIINAIVIVNNNNNNKISNAIVIVNNSSNNNNSIANCMVYLAKKKVINLNMAHN